MHPFFRLAIGLYFVLSSLPALAQKGGIVFRPESLDQVFQMAKKTGKPVFVEIFSPTCHVCQSFMPTLADKRVGTFYNNKYISTKQDIMSRPVQDWLNRRKLYIPSLPMFLYFDPQQNLVHMAMSNNSTDEVIRHGTVASNPKTRSQTYRARFDAGERSPNFLIDYAMLARVTTDSVANIRAMDAYARQQPPGSLANNTNWLALQKLVIDMDNPMAQYLINNLNQYKSYGLDQVRAVAENILMMSLYSSRGLAYSPDKVQQIRQQLIKVGVDAKAASARTLLSEVYAYLRAKQSVKAATRMNEQVNSVTFLVPEYIYIARYFNRQSPDAADVPSVVKWINKALTTGKPDAKQQADLYFELADAHRRAGKIADAQRAAQKSMDLARTGGIDTKRNTDQLGRLK